MALVDDGADAGRTWTRRSGTAWRCCRSQAAASWRIVMPSTPWAAMSSVAAARMRARWPARSAPAGAVGLPTRSRSPSPRPRPTNQALDREGHDRRRPTDRPPCCSRSGCMPGMEDGSVTLAFRRWRRPAAKPGGRQRTAIGELAIDAVDVVDRRRRHRRRTPGGPATATGRSCSASWPGQAERHALPHRAPPGRATTPASPCGSDADLDRRRAGRTIAARLDRLDSQPAQRPVDAGGAHAHRRAAGGAGARARPRLGRETLAFKRTSARSRRWG